MSNGVDFRKLALDLRGQLTIAEQRNAELERKHVDSSNYLRECLKRININQHHMFCLALDDFLNSAEPSNIESGDSHEQH